MPNTGRQILAPSYGFIYAHILIDNMPHGKDTEDDTSEIESTYECLDCGDMTEAETHPGECDCGGEYQNRAKSLE